MLILVELPCPLWIANINVHVDRTTLGSRESSLRLDDLLGLKWEGDYDKSPQNAGVEDDRSPTGRNLRQDIGNLEARFLGGERGSDKDLGKNLVWKGMNGGPWFSNPGCLGLCTTSFKGRRGRGVTLCVGDVLEQHE